MKAKILIIDGDLRNCLNLKRVLVQNNFEVAIENDGIRGLNKILTQDYDFCILETRLHLKTGFSVVTEIRKVNSVIPIFFISPFFYFFITIFAEFLSRKHYIF